MVWESLRGREGRPHHSPLNVNYAFKTVFIGEAARHPMPLAPCVCSLGQRCGQIATRRRYAEALRGGPPRRRSRRVGGGGACLRACGQSMRGKVMEAARTVCTLVAVLPRAHARG